MFIKNDRVKKVIISINIIFFIIIILFSPPAFYIFNLNFYEFLFEKNDVFTVLNKDDVLNFSKEIFEFFKYKKELNSSDTALMVRYTGENKNEFLSFTDNEISHLYDVRGLLTGVFIVYAAGIVLFFVIMLILIEKNISRFLYSTSLIFLISSGIMILVIFLLYFMGNNFPVLFENFHRIFFPQGNYSFPGDSLLITVFPAGFFNDFFIRLVYGSGIMSAVFLFLGVILILISKFMRKYNKRDTQ